MSGKQWEIPYRPITAADYTGAYPPLLEAVLALRGIPPEEAEEFLHPSIGQLGDPMELKDMPRAVQRIRQAIDAGETVAVYGDYDVDGITSLCLLVSYLRSRDMTCLAYIPNRLEEGYGVNLQAIDQFKAAGVTLIITVDCGITAMDEVEYARDLGIDMVITDHHECRGLTCPRLWRWSIPNGRTAPTDTTASPAAAWPLSWCAPCPGIRKRCSGSTPTWWPWAPWPI